MRKLNYKPKEVKSLKEIRYEKARITIEMAYIQQQIQEDAESFLHGGFLQSMGIGWSMFASAGKWLIGIKALLKGWKWIMGIIRKKKEKE